MIVSERSLFGSETQTKQTNSHHAIGTGSQILFSAHARTSFRMARNAPANGECVPVNGPKFRRALVRTFGRSRCASKGEVDDPYPQ
jgi:hypothetical protein